MKIGIMSTQIFTVPPNKYGGLERQAYYQAKALFKLGHDVTVFAPTGSISNGWKIFETGEAEASNPEDKRYLLFRDSLKEMDYILDNSWAKMSMMDYDNSLGIMHGYRPYARYPPHGMLVAVSAWHAKEIEKLMGKIDYVNPAYFKVPFLYNAVDSTFTTGNHEDYLIYMSRFSGYKGASVFIDLCVRHKRKGILIGGEKYVEDPSFIQLIKDKAKKNGLDFRGEVEEKEKIELLSHADMLVSPLMPPYYEVFGMNLVEAMSYGTIPYVTMEGAAEEIVGDGGWTIDTFSSMMRAKELPPTTDEMRKKAVERAKFFSIDMLGKRIEALIKYHQEEFLPNKDMFARIGRWDIELNARKGLKN
ncbi:MAG: glycosyltransferase [Thermoplasmatales archaeon]